MFTIAYIPGSSQLERLLLHPWLAGWRSGLLFWALSSNDQQSTQLKSSWKWLKWKLKKVDRCELLIFLGRTEDLVPRFLHTTLKLYQACFFYSLKIYKNIKICFFLGWKRRGWRWARELWLWIMNHVDIIKLMILKQDKQLILRQHKADWTQRRTHWLSPTLKAASSRSWLVTKFQYYPFQHHMVYC